MSSRPGPNFDNSVAPPQKHRSRLWWPLVAGIAYGVSIRLVFSGEAGGPYNAMMSSFTLLVPVLVGAVTVMVAERTARRSWSYYFWAAAAANVLFVIGTLALTIEGLICCILAVPLFAVLGGIGGLLTGMLCRQKEWSRHSVHGLAILPLILGALEQQVPLPNTVLTAEQSRVSCGRPQGSDEIVDIISISVYDVIGEI